MAAKNENPPLNPKDVVWDPGVGPWDFMTQYGIRRLDIRISQPSGPALLLGFEFPATADAED